MFPRQRPRRLRSTPALRRLVSQTSLEPRHLVLPMFVADATEPRAVTSMPGVVQHTRDSLRRAAADPGGHGVGGLMISPAYGYEAVTDDNPDSAAEIFMTRREVNEKFRAARELLARFKLATSPVYLDFLGGGRDLECAAWANPTYNVKGWRGPCYLVADDHYETYAELVASTDWNNLGPGNDPRCEHCLVHCGFEPAAVLAANRSVRDMLRMAVWQMT